MPINTPNLSRLFQTAGQQKQQQGTGYTNLNRLFQASSGNQLGQKVAGNIQQQIGNVQSQLGEQQKQFQTESEKGQLGGEADIAKRKEVIGRFTAAPTEGAVGSGRSDATQPSTEDLASFEKFRAGQYGGPQGLKDVGGLSSTAAQLKNQVSNFSPSGTQELLRRSVGGDRYTQGQQRLDALLMNRSALTPIQRQAASLGQQINRADLAASGQAELNKNLAQRFGAETTEQLGAGMTGIESQVKGQLTAAQAQEKDRLQKIQAIQNFAANKTPKLDESGNPVLDQYGNPVYDTSIKARGEGDSYSQADFLQNLLKGQGAQSEELSQLFGTGNIASQKSLYDKQVADIELGRKKALASQYAGDIMGRDLVSRYSQYRPYGQDFDYSTAATGFSEYGPRDIEKMRSDIQSGSLDINSLLNREIGGQSAPGNEQIGPTLQHLYNIGGKASEFAPQLETAKSTYLGGTGMVGKNLLEGGDQEQFYSNLAKTLGNSQNAQGLTEAGVASAQQRQQYEALNKLLGKTSSQSKYRTDDPTKYEAGKFLLNPEQLKRTL